MFALIRALTYASVFVGVFLVFVPARLITWSGITPPASIGVPEAVGLVILAAGLALVLWCVLSFAMLGRGTPAPFDPPRALVVRGPYRWVRNPMYIGAAFVLAGAAVYYLSLPLAGYAALFFVVTHLFVILYEEPVLRRTFGAEYEEYCGRVRRWTPGGSTG